MLAISPDPAFWVTLAVSSGMAYLEADPRLRQVVSPALDKIIKNASWRNHAKLTSECKAVLEQLNKSKPDPNSDSDNSGPGPLHDGGSEEYSFADSESILSPVINATGFGVLKITNPVGDCIQKLIAHEYLRGEADTSRDAAEAKLLTKLIESVCKCHDLEDDQMKLLVLKLLVLKMLLLSTVPSSFSPGLKRVERRRPLRVESCLISRSMDLLWWCRGSIS